MDKRKLEDEALGSSQSQLVKRKRQQESEGQAVVASKPVSRLQAPNIELIGHTGEVYCARFDPTGAHIASGSFDRTVLLWKADGNNDNIGVLRPSKGAILDLLWSRDASLLFSATSDGSIGVWDVESGNRVRRHQGHSGVVNAISGAHYGNISVVSAGDDATVGLWDVRKKEAIDYFVQPYPLTAIAMDTSGSKVYVGGIAGDILVWDIRKQAALYTLSGHNETLTSLAIAPDGQTLLSFSMDNTVRTWDIRPYADERQLSIFQGAVAGAEQNLIRAAWSPDGQTIGVGGGDCTVTLWDVASKSITHKLPGHKGCVNDISFSPIEPVIISASTDRTMILGEINEI